MTNTNPDTNTKSKKEKDLSTIEKGLFVKDSCIIDIVKDFGFKYDENKNKYFNEDKSLCIDKKTRLIYSLKEIYDLSSVVKMYKLNILDIKELK